MAIAAALAEAVGLVDDRRRPEPRRSRSLGALAMGAAFSLLYPSLSLIVVERVPETRRGAALGTFTAFFDAGVGLGAPLAGIAAALDRLRGRLPALGRRSPSSRATTIALAIAPRGRRRAGRRGLS